MKLAPSCTKSLIPKKEAAEKSVELTNTSNEKKEADNSPDVKPKKDPSKDSPLRWISLVIYLVISTPLIVAMVALVAALN